MLSPLIPDDVGIFQRNPNPMWIYDCESLGILGVNQAACSVYGYSESEFLNLTIRDLRPAEDLAALEAFIQTSIPDGGTRRPWRHRVKNGSIIFAEISSFAQEIAGRRCRVVQAVDVTAKVEADRALATITDRYRAAAAATSDAIWDWDLPSNLVDWTEGLFETFGHDAKVVRQQPCWWNDSIHPQDHDRVVTSLMSAIGGTLIRWEQEYRFRRGNGNYAYVLDRGKIYRDENGKPYRMVGSMMDVTERREAQAERDRVFELSLDIICVVDFDAVVHRINPAFSRILGWASDDLVGRNLRDFIHPEDQERGIELTARLRAGEAIVHIENRYLTTRGTWRTMHWSVQPDTEFGLLCCIGRDMTEFLEKQNQLLESKARVDQILERLTDAYMAIDENWVVTRVNQRANIVLKGFADNLVGRSLWEAFPGSERSIFGDLAREVLHTGSSRELLAFYPPLGKWFESHLYPFGDGICIFFRDVTDRVIDERQLRESEAKLREAQSISSIGNWSLDLASDRIEWSDQVYDVLGYDRNGTQPTLAEVQSRIVFEDRELIQSAQERLLATGTGYDVELRVNRLDGGLTYVQSLGRLERDDDGKPTRIVGTVQDITKRKLIEIELAERQVESDRLHSMNQELLAELTRRNAELEDRVRERTQELESFSYSVAHDIRAPLRGIDGFSQILADEYGPKLDDMAREYIERVRTQTHRISQLIDDLLSLSRITRKEIVRSHVDVSKLALEIFSYLRDGESDRNVEIIVQPGTVAFADESAFRVLWSNLIGNALKFSKSNPIAKIEIGSEIKAEETIFWIKDNGAGFDMQYRDMLFQPFQRLHSGSEFAGTGIGLAIVDRVIRRHGGRIWAESSVGNGAKFWFTMDSKRHHDN